MLNKIEDAFPQADVDGCLQAAPGSEFRIYDHELEKRCYVQNSPEGITHFKIINRTEQPINFLAIDKCLFMDNVATQRCDCAVFNDQVFCFIEIKNDIVGKG